MTMSDFTNPYKNILEKIIAIFVVGILALFPLYSTDKYFHLLRDRVTYLYVTAALMGCIVVFVSAMSAIACKVIKRRQTGTGIFLKQIFLGWNLSVTDVCFLFLLGITVLATVCSPWPKAAFYGTEGRFQGCAMWMTYGCIYICVSRFFSLKEWHLDLFLAIGVLTALWGISDYMGMDIFGWIASMKEEQKHMFTSSFGNINTYTAVMSLYMTVAGILFLTKSEQNKSYVRYGVAFFVLLTAMTTGQSDNAVIGIAAFFFLAPFVLVSNPTNAKEHKLQTVYEEKDTLGIKKRFHEKMESRFPLNYCRLCMKTTNQVRYLLLVGILFFALSFVSFVSAVHPNPYISMDSGILLKICKNHWSLLALVGAVFSLIAWILWNIVYKRQEKRVVSVFKVWSIIYIVMLIYMILAVIFANCNSAWNFHGLEAYLRFNDSWGSHRGFIWRLSYEYMRDASLFRQLIGFGPETFKLAMTEAYGQEMLDSCRMIFDSPHNEFIQHVYQTGLCGVCCYVSMIGIAFQRCMAKPSSHIIISVAMAVCVYACVSLINISVPMTQAYMVLFFAFLESAHRREPKTESFFQN